MKRYVLSIGLGLCMFTSGCAVKSSDNDATKVAKHVVNAPLYAVMAVGAAGTAVGGGIGYGVSKTTDAIRGEELYYGESLIGSMDMDALDHNASYAKFFQNNDYAFYKDAENNSYLYLIKRQQLIKSDDLSYFKRWSIAQVEKRATLIFTGIQLPEGVDEKTALSTMKKDRFGNPVAWGNNTVIRIKEHRGGLFLTRLDHIIILIGNGADTVNLSDPNAPMEYTDQIRYYFPEQTKNMEDDALSKLIIYDPNMPK